MNHSCHYNPSEGSRRSVSKRMKNSLLLSKFYSRMTDSLLQLNSASELLLSNELQKRSTTGVLSPKKRVNSLFHDRFKFSTYIELKNVIETTTTTTPMG
mmetsp:Transcript_35866/g.39993  ORF Transcript_35866/g.39993 Transcript_35866/m.39993 type:complete len:99 (+) Transcript_35866:90-386(+)